MVYLNLGEYSPGGIAASDYSLGLYDTGPGTQIDLYTRPYPTAPYGPQHTIPPAQGPPAAPGDPPKLTDSAVEGFSSGNEFKLKNPFVLFILLVLLAVFLDLWAQFGSKMIKKFTNGGEDLSWTQILMWASIVSALLVIVIWFSGLTFSEVGERTI